MKPSSITGVGILIMLLSGSSMLSCTHPILKRSISSLNLSGFAADRYQDGWYYLLGHYFLSCSHGDLSCVFFQVFSTYSLPQTRLFGCPLTVRLSSFYIWRRFFSDSFVFYPRSKSGTFFYFFFPDEINQIWGYYFVYCSRDFFCDCEGLKW